MALFATVGYNPWMVLGYLCCGHIMDVHGCSDWPGMPCQWKLNCFRSTSWPDCYSGIFACEYSALSSSSKSESWMSNQHRSFFVLQTMSNQGVWGPAPPRCCAHGLTSIYVVSSKQNRCMRSTSSSLGTVIIVKVSILALSKSVLVHRGIKCFSLSNLSKFPSHIIIRDLSYLLYVDVTILLLSYN